MNSLHDAWKVGQATQRWPYKIALAAGQDAGDRSAHHAGRERWAEQDWRIACQTFDRVYRATVKL